MVLGVFSTTSIDDVAVANGNGLRWFHLWLTLKDDVLKDQVKRAEKAGFKAFVITVDQPNVVVPRVNTKLFEFVTFPILKFPRNRQLNEDYRSYCYVSEITWERIEWIRTLTSLPLVIKGLLTAEDAREAVQHNVDAIIVSNHGARQLNCVPATVSHNL